MPKLLKSNTNFSTDLCQSDNNQTVAPSIDKESINSDPHSISSKKSSERKDQNIDKDDSSFELKINFRSKGDQTSLEEPVKLITKKNLYKKKSSRDRIHSVESKNSLSARRNRGQKSLPKASNVPRMRSSRNLVAFETKVSSDAMESKTPSNLESSKKDAQMEQNSSKIEYKKLDSETTSQKHMKIFKKRKSNGQAKLNDKSDSARPARVFKKSVKSQQKFALVPRIKSKGLSQQPPSSLPKSSNSQDGHIVSLVRKKFSKFQKKEQSFKTVRFLEKSNKKPTIPFRGTKSKPSIHSTCSKYKTDIERSSRNKNNPNKKQIAFKTLNNAYRKSKILTPLLPRNTNNQNQSEWRGGGVNQTQTIMMKKKGDKNTKIKKIKSKSYFKFKQQPQSDKEMKSIRVFPAKKTPQNHEIDNNQETIGKATAAIAKEEKRTALTFSGKEPGEIDLTTAAMVEKIFDLHSFFQTWMSKYKKSDKGQQFVPQVPVPPPKSKVNNAAAGPAGLVGTAGTAGTAGPPVNVGPAGTVAAVVKTAIDDPKENMDKPITNDDMEDLNDALTDLNTSINTLKSSYGSIIKSLMNMQQRRVKKDQKTIVMMNMPPVPVTLQQYQRTSPPQDKPEQIIEIEDIAERSRIINYDEKYHVDRFLDQHQRDKVFNALFREVEEINTAFKRFRTFFDNEGYFLPELYKESDFRISRKQLFDCLKVIKEIYKSVCNVLKLYNADLLDMFRLNSSTM